MRCSSSCGSGISSHAHCHHVAQFADEFTLHIRARTARPPALCTPKLVAASKQTYTADDMAALLKALSVREGQAVGAGDGWDDKQNGDRVARGQAQVARGPVQPHRRQDLPSGRHGRQRAAATAGGDEIDFFA